MEHHALGKPLGCDAKWSLYWTDRHVSIPAGFLPVLDEWADIDDQEPEFNVYDNPDAFLTCNNDSAKALCHPERTRRSTKRIRPPATDRCDPACANIARTDTHIRHLITEIANLGAEMTSPLTPIPLRERLKQRITALQRIVDRHERTKIAPAADDEETSRP
jgi:hypothetical protein